MKRDNNGGLRARIGLAGVMVGAALLGGCGGGLYNLPAPPPEGEWTHVSLVPGEDARASQRRYIDARATALELYGALKGARWAEVWELLSSETQAALTYSSPEPDKGGLAALEKGELRFPGGNTARFDPTTALMVADLKTFEDEVSGEAEAETDLRKEIYAIDRDGSRRKLVMIWETGRWKLHRTRIP